MFNAKRTRPKRTAVQRRRAGRAGAIGLVAGLIALGVLSLAGEGKATTPVRVPLPRSRPAEAPKPSALPDAAMPHQAEPEASGPRTEAAQPPEPSACRKALTDEIVIAPSVPPIKGPGGCGGDDLVRLEAVVLPDKSKVAFKPAAILRCPMASAVADWVRTDISALASSLGALPKEVDNFDSYECRGRNRVVGGQLSEHGKANALDVRSIAFTDGRVLALTDRKAERSLRESVLHSVCARFSTVLGPSSDWYHEDHVHLDLAQRRNGYRICEWDVLDPMPATAPMLPVPRPDEAPPREAGAASAGGQDSGAASSVPKAEDNDDLDHAATAQPNAQPRKKQGRRKAPLSVELRKPF